ncbi:hypothetical protein [Rhodococcus qingshengii]|uniref:hypothetical protein n=1 Tax=Rhodococcus qingshengii TaxID=334542 RepID=UPI00360298FA
MALHDRRERWLANARSIHSTTDQLLTGGALPADRDKDILMESTVGSLQSMFMDQVEALDGDAPEGRLASAVEPLATALRKFDALGGPKLPKSNGELQDVLSELRDVAGSVAATLDTDPGLRVQSVDEVIDEFAESYRVALLLTLTACHALATKVGAWSRSKDDGKVVGDHLDVSTIKLVDTNGVGTVPMPMLSNLMTAPPSIMTPSNQAAMFAEMFSGGTPPPLYRMAYGQWFGTVAAMWEDVYRERLATAYGVDSEGQPWSKNDVKSEFFYELCQIRHDFAHKDGLCDESAGNKVLNWGIAGEPLAPTPRQMLSLIDSFPASELRKTPVRVPRTSERLPYNFPSEWVEKVKDRVVAIEKTKRLRPEVLKSVIDKWLDES